MNYQLLTLNSLDYGLNLVWFYSHRLNTKQHSLTGQTFTILAQYLDRDCIFFQSMNLPREG